MKALIRYKIRLNKLIFEMKLDTKILIRKTIVTFLLLINIGCLFSSQYHIAYTKENGDCIANYKTSKPNVETFSLEKHGDLKLTENFMVCEFKCNDGSDEIIIDIELAKVLQYIRDYFDKPIHINSAYRTREHDN